MHIILKSRPILDAEKKKNVQGCYQNRARKNHFSQLLKQKKKGNVSKNIKVIGQDLSDQKYSKKNSHKKIDTVLGNKSFIEILKKHSQEARKKRDLYLNNPQQLEQNLKTRDYCGYKYKIYKQSPSKILFKNIIKKRHQTEHSNEKTCLLEKSLNYQQDKQNIESSFRNPRKFSQINSQRSNKSFNSQRYLLQSYIKNKNHLDINNRLINNRLSLKYATSRKQDEELSLQQAQSYAQIKRQFKKMSQQKLSYYKICHSQNHRKAERYKSVDRSNFRLKIPNIARVAGQSQIIQRYSEISPKENIIQIIKPVPKTGKILKTQKNQYDWRKALNKIKKSCAQNKDENEQLIDQLNRRSIRGWTKYPNLLSDQKPSENNQFLYPHFVEGNQLPKIQIKQDKHFYDKKRTKKNK